MPDNEGLVPLADFVAGLRAELKVAAGAREPGVEFEVGPVSVEFGVVTEVEAGAGARVRFWVVEAGGSARRSRQSTHRVSLTLTPMDEHGRPVHIGDSLQAPPP